MAMIHRLINTLLSFWIQEIALSNHFDTSVNKIERKNVEQPPSDCIKGPYKEAPRVYAKANDPCMGVILEPAPQHPGELRGV